MYAVIFRAEIAEFDDQYIKVAEKMRDLAIKEYGCLEFVACAEGTSEIAISYWDNEEQIMAWRQDIEHRAAQQLGKTEWYKSYSVQVCKVERSYRS